MDLFVPEGGKIQRALRARHADERYVAAWACEAEGVLHGSGRADTVEDLGGTAHDDRLAELGLVRLRTEHLGEFRVGLVRVDDFARSQPKGLSLLSPVFGDADDAAGVREEPQGRYGKEADAAGSDHQRGLVPGWGGLERGVDGAGEGLDSDGCLVGDGVGNAVEL